MTHASWNGLQGVGTLNLEGLTLKRGELNTGSSGEGYVDRRHPHTYLHELLGGFQTSSGAWRASLFAGRGFVPFGSDDPMTRPIVKYPINHHLAQILERAVTVAAVQRGPFIAEAGVFGGDEPVSPTKLPEWNRFGDSWATRLTVLPIPGAELSASFANVTSPEVRGGGGFDDRKVHVGARFDRLTSVARTYALAEWARTDERTKGHTETTLFSFLGEAAVCRAGFAAAGRIERTDRTEEEQTLDPFRFPIPPSDLSSLGVSRWTTFTLSLSSPAVGTGFISGRPFVELSRVHVSPGNPPGLFSAELRYGAARMWMASAGVRLRAGATHSRMGRYGAAIPVMRAPAMGTHEAAAGHEMTHQMPADSHTAHSVPTQCSL